MQKAYEINIYDYVEKVDAAAHGITDLDTIDPVDFFITSGDAVSKAKMMEQRLWALAGMARKRYGKSKRRLHKSYLQKIWVVAGRARRFTNILKTMRGDAVFAETEWRDHKLYVTPKNPRQR